MENEIKNLIFKMDYYAYSDDDDVDDFFYYVCYDRESKRIKYLKYLVELSNTLQWWYRDEFTSYAKKVICINRKPE